MINYFLTIAVIIISYIVYQIYTWRNDSQRQEEMHNNINMMIINNFTFHSSPIDSIYLIELPYTYTISHFANTFNIKKMIVINLNFVVENIDSIIINGYDLLAIVQDDLAQALEKNNIANGNNLMKVTHKNHFNECRKYNSMDIYDHIVFNKDNDLKSSILNIFEYEKRKPHKRITCDDCGYKPSNNHCTLEFY